jgi:hypothetical protein
VWSGPHHDPPNLADWSFQDPERHPLIGPVSRRDGGRGTPDDVRQIGFARPEGSSTVQELRRVREQVHIRTEIFAVNLGRRNG